MSRIENPNIGVISIPMIKANEVPFSNFINVLNNFTKNLVVIATYADSINVNNYVQRGSKIYNITHCSKKNSFLSIFQYIKTQINITYYVIKYWKNVNIWIFYDGEGLIIPLFIAKVLQKKVILLFGRSIFNEDKSQNFNLKKLFSFLWMMSIYISDNIILYSPILVNKWNFEKYNHKVLIAHKHYINLDDFKVLNDYSRRPDYIGYVGRLIELKGILNFVESINQIVSIKKKTKILIAGDGALKHQIELYLTENNLTNYVNLVGWISHENLPKFLNQLKLLVLPSYSEGLPNIMLESMACGTPVLATPVGSITDVILNEENGFLMENNSPSCIAKSIICALDHPKIENISEKAVNFIKYNYSYKKAVESYENIFKNIVVHK